MLRARTALVLCAALVADVALAAPPTLETIAVTPTAASITVGQKQRFTATGTFSDGATHALGPAIANIAAGFNNTCALLTSGGVKCWGDNWYGQLGDGSTVFSRLPRSVKGISTATAVTFSKYDGPHGCALLASGAIKCWGENSYGQLGNGTRIDATTPVIVIGISSATAVAAGRWHTCALLASGAVQCWGTVNDGGLGDGLNNSSPLPVSVTGISTATAVTAGRDHICALLSSGAVQCWGSNASGLGDGTTNAANTPVTVRGISSATAVAAGINSTCALLASGAIQCWGWNVRGQLGDGSNNDSSTPVSVVGISTAVAITAGGWHFCALLRNGYTRCWGQNALGQLGNGTTIGSSIPVRVKEFNTLTKLLDGGGDHTCALLVDGAMRCWGKGDQGQLGDNRVGWHIATLPRNVVHTPGVVWQSSDLSNATITYSGLTTGRAVGNTTITATTAGFINDNAVLTVK
jgi:alpha-tubulin suppressor-like RCC1 family protein